MSHRYYETEEHSAAYQQFRPTPPPSLIKRVMEYLTEKYTGPLDLAIDAGCGTGQNTYFYADYFKKVIGTDISSTQIDMAEKNKKKRNVSFEVSPAENLNVEDGSVQLMTAMVAFHWFDHPKFFQEGLRVLSPGGVMALYGYFYQEFRWDRNPSKNEALKEATLEFLLGESLEPYWPEPVKKYVIPDFEGITIPYQDFIRDDSYYQDRKVSLTHIVEGYRTFSVIANLKEKRGREAADKVLLSLRDRFLAIVKDDLRPEEDADDKIFFTERSPYYLMLARNMPSNKS